jgi:protein-tyrosine kinase
MNAPERIGPLDSLSKIFLAKGLLKSNDIEKISMRQSLYSESFGEAAIALNLLKREDLDESLTEQQNYGDAVNGDSQLDPTLVTAFHPLSRAAEEFRALKSQLMLRWFKVDPRRRILAIVSQRPRDGRSFVAANLAVVFSQQGLRTLLIDADLRSPKIATWFQTSDSAAGLAGILSSRAGLEVIEMVDGLPYLRILPAGSSPPNPQKLVSMPAFGHLLDQVREQFDIVLIDTPAIESFSDAEIIAARAGAALMVVRKNQSPLRGVSDVARRMQDTGVAMVGTMLNHY